MVRYINADIFLKSMITKFKCVPLIGITKYTQGEECFEGEHLDVLINEIPTADVAEVKHGRYIQKGAWHIECSVCGNILAHVGEAKNYCPNCGANMGGTPKERGK